MKSRKVFKKAWLSTEILICMLATKSNEENDVLAPYMHQLTLNDWTYSFSAVEYPLCCNFLNRSGSIRKDQVEKTFSISIQKQNLSRKRKAVAASVTCEEPESETELFKRNNIKEIYLGS